jgi:hypothetical protein
MYFVVESLLQNSSININSDTGETCRFTTSSKLRYNANNQVKYQNSMAYCIKGVITLLHVFPPQ